ncbi:MAG: membrane protein insertion efficiency factor YidD [Dehalococcoidia bacterium]|nr:membrane protein insertion efficiency factor YidD [Dehalococcoidia bacterium]MSQ35206.1 membrane protein insertion efficiency factor YidD [Dehalococcoidia bacterium]
MKRAALAMMQFYKAAISPYMPGMCKYEPSCSAYAGQAIRGHGAVRGSWMAVRRLARCHPWRKGGYDPVPEPR